MRIMTLKKFLFIEGFLKNYGSVEILTAIKN